jgi:ABC-type uncharacterized transport system permease subunit
MDLSLVVLLVVFGLQQGTAISIAAGGELIGEKSGILNIGIQGVMTMGAFSAAVVNYIFSASYPGFSPVLGLAAGMATGVVVALVFSLMCTRLNVDQVIAGIGINVFALGFAYVISALHWKVDGPPASNSTVTPLFTVSSLASNPVISPLVVVMLVLPVLSYLLLKRTRLGLRIRAVGESPRAAEAAGVSVGNTRVVASAIAGALMGLGGAYMTVDLYNQFTPLSWAVSATGFIALAAVIAGAWNPFYATGMSIVFGVSLGATHVVESTSASTTYIIQMVPYVVTIIILAIASKRLRPPTALGLPYAKE